MRALLIVLDSVGIGNAPDAASYGDAGANTLLHLLERGKLDLVTLWPMGLGQILERSPVAAPCASFGRMREISAGKDSTTGHWELAGIVTETPFRTFKRFPIDLVSAIERDCGIEFIGNVCGSGTNIIHDLGPEHLCTRSPILYTSADSVLQIAAHEDIISIDDLYQICRIARRHADGYSIARVIARPFSGEIGSFSRTPRRHDFSIRPPRTVLNAIQESGYPVVAIGKTSELFDGEGITTSVSTRSNADGMQKISEIWAQTHDGLVFANLVDFDTLFGHRRDPEGYAAALQEFDGWLGRFLNQCCNDDLLIITADHGNDPTFRGTDHTREQVPLLVSYGCRSRNLGCRQSFADVAASLAIFFGLTPWHVGEPFI